MCMHLGSVYHREGDFCSFLLLFAVRLAGMLMYPSHACMRFHFDTFTIYQSIEGAESICNR